MDNCYLEFRSTTYDKPYWFNIVTNKSTFQKPATIKNCDYKIPTNWVRVKSRTQDKFYFYDKMNGTTQWFLPFPSDQCNKSLSWKDNSCYIDSILQSIFGPGVNNTLAREILYTNLNFDKRTTNLCDVKHREKIQRKLRRISDTIQNISKKDIEDVTEFKEALKNCPYSGAGRTEQFYGTAMRDAGEFLNYILNFFPVSDKAVREETKYVTNEGESLKFQRLSKDYNSSIIIKVFWEKLIEPKQQLSLENFLRDEIESTFDEPFTVEEVQGQQFTRRFTVREIIDSPAVIFSVDRVTFYKNIFPSTDDYGGYDPNARTYYIDTNISVPNRITLSSGKSLKLSAIVIYRSHHYTCYFKCKNEWYYYDDKASPKIIKQDLDKKLIEKQGTQYFYTDEV